MVLRAFDLGITHFDLANNYGPPPGSAEETFGRILRRTWRAYRDELIISTKAGYDMWPGPYGEWGSRKVPARQPGPEPASAWGWSTWTSSTATAPTRTRRWKRPWCALDQVVRSGKALYVGISNYQPEQTRQAAEILRGLGTPCLIHQPIYSMFNRWVEDGLLDVLGEEGIGCIAFSPLAQGLLTDRYLDGIPEDSRAAKPHGFLRPAADHRGEDRQGAAPQRAGPRPRSDAGADGAGLGAAPPADDLGADRRQPGRTDRRCGGGVGESGVLGGGAGSDRGDSEKLDRSFIVFQKPFPDHGHRVLLPAVRDAGSGEPGQGTIGPRTGTAG